MGAVCTSGNQTCPLYDPSEQEPILAATSDVEDALPKWQPKNYAAGREYVELAMREANREMAMREQAQGHSSCARSCIAFLALYVLAVLAVTLTTLGIADPGACAVEDAGLEDVQAFPLRAGTRANLAMASGSPLSSVDLTGVWYLRWDNQASSLAIRLYHMFRTNVLISFAGSYADGALLHVPAQLDRQWGYSNAIASLAQMLVHSVLWDPQQTLDLTFLNSTYATAPGFGTMRMLSKDDWLLQTQLFGQDYTYALTRVLYENGNTHETWWPQLLSFMNGYSLRVWGEDNVCRRRCEVAARFMLVPGWSACKLCEPLC